MNRFKSTSIALLGLAAVSVLGGGCKKTTDPVWTAESSAAFRAAWEKRRAGDDKGADAILAALAKKDDTRAGRRAGDRRVVDLSSMASFSSLMQALAESLKPAPSAEPDPILDDNLPDEPDQNAAGEPSPGGP